MSLLSYITIFPEEVPTARRLEFFLNRTDSAQTTGFEGDFRLTTLAILAATRSQSPTPPWIEPVAMAFDSSSVLMHLMRSLWALKQAISSKSLVHIFTVLSSEAVMSRSSPMQLISVARASCPFHRLIPTQSIQPSKLRENIWPPQDLIASISVDWMISLVRLSFSSTNESLMLSYDDPWHGWRSVWGI